MGDEPPSGIDAPGPEFASIEDVEVLAPADISTYGMGVPPNTGWWISWDYLRYTVSPPHRQIIGNPNVVENYATGTSNFFGTASSNPNGTTFINSTTGTNGSNVSPTNSNGAGGSFYGVQLGPMDTGFIGDGPSNGYRWEGGWMDRDEGFMLSDLQALHQQSAGC